MPTGEYEQVVDVRRQYCPRTMPATAATLPTTLFAIEVVLIHNFAAALLTLFVSNIIPTFCAGLYSSTIGPDMGKNLE